MNSLAIIKPRKLTQAQQHLYALICIKTQNDERITFDEAKNIYVNFVNRYMINGTPHHYNYWAERVQFNDGSYGYNAKLEPMDEDEIEFATQHWLIENLGRLVLKGLLEVMPRIELRKIQNKAF